ncbi:Transmembrane protein 192 [Labeo rohita]|uniref:Transmembrane protein 192 n=1 Tax=Labeo rohita TaxID=84645 RepID=A0ABQ8N0Y6_LABRO|nr:Transmembrane protein 192 [Labeo rohita]
MCLSCVCDQNNTNVDFTQSTDDDPLIDGPLISQDTLESVIKREFKKLPTHWAVGVISFLHVVYVVVCILITVFCWLSDEHTPECTAALQGIDSKTVVLLGKVALWVLVFIYDRFVQHHHNAVRRRGYLDFYRLTRGIKNLPLLIHSTGNALVLTVIAPSALLDASVKNLSVYLLLAIICLELLLSVICLLKYAVYLKKTLRDSLISFLPNSMACWPPFPAVHVVRFNSKKPHPDVTEEERSHGCSSTCTLIFQSHVLWTGQTGAHVFCGLFHRDCSSLEDVVEKQADLIDYLKQHNSVLSRRILALTAQQIRA